MTKHKVSKIFLWILYIVNIVLMLIAQIKMIKGSDITSVIPISFDFTAIQVLLFNTMLVAVVIALISVILMYLVVDAPYSIGEVFSNCAGIFLIPSIILLGFCIYNTIKAPIMIDKISIIVSGVLFVALNTLAVSSILTIDEDERL